MGKSKTKKNVLITIFVIIGVIFYIFLVINDIRKSFNIFGDLDLSVPTESFAIINIQGTIQGNNQGPLRAGYDHEAIKDYIDELIDDDGNTGIFLSIDSGGGTVYHSDEMYNKLIEYKEKTGRPIHAYFNTMAASGAYYIACAADTISANKNCWTGSIGVIISLTNLSELYNKLGIDEVLITSGANKGMGSPGSPMTEEHRAIYQSLVDESYEQFANIVSKGRNIPIDRVKQIADGRIYSATQAKEISLVDNIESYEEAIATMEEITGTEGYHKELYVPSKFESLFMKIEDIMPKSEMETAVNLAKSELSGIPLYMYIK